MYGSAWFGSVWGWFLGGILGGIARAGFSHRESALPDPLLIIRTVDQNSAIILFHAAFLKAEVYPNFPAHSLSSFSRGPMYTVNIAAIFALKKNGCFSDVLRQNHKNSGCFLKRAVVFYISTAPCSDKLFAGILRSSPEGTSRLLRKGHTRSRWFMRLGLD